MEDGVQTLTVYAFSTENWNRDPMEVNTLMTIFAKYAEQFVSEALSRNVRVRILSTDFSKLPIKVQESVHVLEKETSKCNGFRLNICLSYGGRAEIVAAAQRLCKRVESKELTSNQIDEEIFASELSTADIGG